MGKKEIFIVTRTLDTEYGLDVDVEPFKNREEAEKCAETFRCEVFGEWKKEYESILETEPSFADPVVVDSDETGDYEFHKEESGDRCEVHILTKEIDL